MTISASFFEYMQNINDFFWSHLGFSLIIMGVYLTIKTKGFQFKVLLNPKKNLLELHHDSKHTGEGTHPFMLYFASIGGMIGLGNLVGVVTVTTIGGPGGIFWLVVASFAGMLIKYSENCLGVTHRIKNSKKGYDGGPMYYLQVAFGNKYIASFVCLLLCIYGVEVYQFNILAEVLNDSFAIDKHWIVGILVLAIIFSAIGGVHRYAEICAAMMPIFLVIYVIMCVWVIINNGSEFLKIIPLIFKSAFTGHAAVGGFAGASVILAAQYGTQWAVYTGDIGIGYDSVIQSETKAKTPEKQARIAIYGLFSSTLISVLTSLILLVTGFWKLGNKLHPSQYVGKILENYFPYIEYFMLVLIILASSTTIIGYLVVGIKCAKYLSPKLGEKIYIIYAAVAFSVFSFFDQSQVILIMSVSGGLLMMCNLLGIFKLRKELKFK